MTAGLPGVILQALPDPGGAAFAIGRSVPHRLGYRDFSGALSER